MAEKCQYAPFILQENICYELSLESHLWGNSNEES